MANKIKYRRQIGLPDYIHIQSPWDTISYCRFLIEKKERGGYLRFGDGDVNLLRGERDSYQSASNKLKAEMKEAFELGGKGIMKCLPLHSKKYGRWPGMKFGMHEGSSEWADDLLLKCYEYFIGIPIYSPVALAYLAVMDTPKLIEFLRFLKSWSPIFVGNEHTPARIVESLYGNTVHVPTPKKESYLKIDEIQKSLLTHITERNRQYDVVVIAMGCSGRALAKRLLANNRCNVFVFDFGSLLDAICGWETRTWITIAQKSGDFWQNLLSSI